jgi:hypothetical protein
MKQNLLPHLTSADEADQRIFIGAGLEIEIIDGVYPKAKLYRSGIFIKHVDLSDKIDRRLFIIEAIELGAVVSKLARVLGISRQSVYNYIDIKKHFGIEGLINSYNKIPCKPFSRGPCKIGEFEY